jgi:hypothetical protein
VAPTIRHAPEALLLRRWAIRQLARSPGSPVTATDEAWRLFLETEQCAAALNTSSSSAQGGSVLAKYAISDIQRALSARAQVAAIGAIAREKGWPVVLLKGAAAAAEQRSIYLMDVDVLVRAEHAAPLAAELIRDGRFASGGSASPRHIPPLGSPFALPVEIHTSIDNRWTTLTRRAWGRGRIVPLEGLPGLWRLDPVDHVLHVLGHVVMDHPERRGRLRDTVLLMWALEGLPASATVEIASWIDHNPYVKPLTDQLEFAGGIARGEPRPDPFEAAAFARYWILERRERWNPLRLRFWEDLYPTTWYWVMALASGWSSRTWVLDGLLEPSAAPSFLGVTAWLERRAPRAGRALRVALRAAHYSLTFVVSLPIARIVRREARRAGVTVSGKR